MTIILPPVVGLYSPVPECGKSTLAKELPLASMSVCSLLPFAGPLKEACAAFISLVAGVTLQEAENFVYRRKHLPIPGLYGVTGRVVMQRIGEAGRRMHPELWVLKWEKVAKLRQKQGCIVIADDVRRPNEAAAVVRLGGEIWRLSRAKAEAEADPEVIADVSEGDLEGWQFDRRFSNDGTMEELLDTVRLDLLERPFSCPA